MPLKALSYQILKLVEKRVRKIDLFKPFRLKIQFIDETFFTVGVAQFGHVFKSRIFVRLIKLQVFIGTGTAVIFAAAAAQLLFLLPEKLTQGEQRKGHTEHNGYQ